MYYNLKWLYINRNIIWHVEKCYLRLFCLHCVSACRGPCGGGRLGRVFRPCARITLFGAVVRSQGYVRYYSTLCNYIEKLIKPIYSTLKKYIVLKLIDKVYL